MTTLFVLEEPQYHAVRIGERNRFRGAVLAVRGDPVLEVKVHRGDERVLTCPVDRECVELSFLPILNAATSRFEFELFVDETPIVIHGNGVPLFKFDPAEATRADLIGLDRAVERLPLPPPSLVAMTQGGENVRRYRDSIVASFRTSQTLLRNAGVDPDRVESVLDIGCGSGRLLIGWHLTNPRRRTVGVDINSELIDWNRHHLGEVAEWYEVAALPPLALESSSFDLVMLTSVFTHIPLAWQRVWVAEIARLLRPNGVALLTLNSDLYVHTILDPRGRELFDRIGYAEGLGGAPGANNFSTYHSFEFTTQLVKPLVPLAMLPLGRSREGPPTWFPMAAWQDVYVLRNG